jgi:seryl-tRNA synthetase
MIDLKLLREDPERVRKAYARRGGFEGLDGVLELDARYLELLKAVEALRAEQNVASKAIGQASPEDRPSAIEKAKELSDGLKRLEPDLETVEAELQEAIAYMPNIPDGSVPDGSTEDDNVVEREVGERREFDFEPQDHIALGERLGIFDSERGAKTSGSRFVYLTGPGVILEMALVRFAMDFLGERGFTPVVPPVLVRRHAMFGTGFLPTEEHEFYKSERDDLYLVGTSEVPLAAMHSKEILPADQLPRRYAGYSPCFRREAGSYGKETKGLVRVHQFDKVEQFSFAHPDESWDEFAAIRANQERILQDLELPYRVLVMCAGDLGASAAKKIDNEAWLPGAQRYMEVTSATNATDYQSRRLGIRFKADGGNRLVHTLNGTACAVGRTLVALLENHQRPDGGIRIPDALRPYAGFDKLDPAA